MTTIAQARIIYRVRCDGPCGNVAPESPVRSEAESQAIEAGFVRESRGESPYDYTDYCPDCWARREASS